MVVLWLWCAKRARIHSLNQHVHTHILNIVQYASSFTIKVNRFHSEGSGLSKHSSKRKQRKNRYKVYCCCVCLISSSWYWRIMCVQCFIVAVFSFVCVSFLRRRCDSFYGKKTKMNQRTIVQNYCTINNLRTSSFYSFNWFRRQCETLPHFIRKFEFEFVKWGPPNYAFRYIAYILTFVFQSFSL